MTPKRTTPKAAAVYARISLDKAGEGLGVDRQEQRCRKLAEQKGWRIADTYTDNSISAYNGKSRPEYQRMLADIEGGRIDAVLCVDLDRLTRRPIELEHFMDLADRHQVALANVTGDTDLASSDGRLKARIMGAVARQESEKKGERVSREAEQAARRGIPRGPRRPYGYESDKTIVRESEAEFIREAARRIMAGESASTIAADWNARGVDTAQGAAHGWSSAAILSVLRNPRIAGLRQYHGAIVADGQWPAVVERGAWEALQGRIRRVARVGRPSTNLLSGIARCGSCSAPLWTSWRKNKKGDQIRRYSCFKRPGNPGCRTLSVVAEPLDDLIRDAVIHALVGPKLAQARRAHAGNDREQHRASKDLTAAEARLEELAGDYAAGTITRREWIAARDKANELIDAARRVLDRHSGPLADLPGSKPALREAWDVGGIDWRRALISAVIEKVIVQPSTGATASFDPRRIDLVWRA